jgi:hypothetical protein
MSSFVRLVEIARCDPAAQCSCWHVHSSWIQLALRTTTLALSIVGSKISSSCSNVKPYMDRSAEWVERIPEVWQSRKHRRKSSRSQGLATSQQQLTTNNHVYPCTRTSVLNNCTKMRTCLLLYGTALYPHIITRQMHPHLHRAWSETLGFHFRSDVLSDWVRSPGHRQSHH